MKSKLSEEKPKTAKLSQEKWVRVMPDKGDGYHLHDVFQEIPIGHILFYANDHRIYDGNVLTVAEQEDIAGFITGHHQDMNKLISELFQRSA